MEFAAFAIGFLGGRQAGAGVDDDPRASGADDPAYASGARGHP